MPARLFSIWEVSNGYARYFSYTKSDKTFAVATFTSLVWVTERVDLTDYTSAVNNRHMKAIPGELLSYELHRAHAAIQNVFGCGKPLVANLRNTAFLFAMKNLKGSCVGACTQIHSFFKTHDIVLALSTNYAVPPPAAQSTEYLDTASGDGDNDFDLDAARRAIAGRFELPTVGKTNVDHVAGSTSKGVTTVLEPTSTSLSLLPPLFSDFLTDFLLYSSNL